MKYNIATLKQKYCLLEEVKIHKWKEMLRRYPDKVRIDGEGNEYINFGPESASCSSANAQHAKRKTIITECYFDVDSGSFLYELGYVDSNGEIREIIGPDYWTKHMFKRVKKVKLKIKTKDRKEIQKSLGEQDDPFNRKV